MSPASYLTAPPRVAKARIAERARYDRGMPWWTWLSLGLLIAVVLAGTAALAVWGIRLWRALRDVGGATVPALETLLQRADEIDRRAAALAERSTDLDRSLVQLAESRQ